MAEPSSSALAVVPMEGVGGGEIGGREYRKGNWTLHETVVLIAAKKKDDERRLKGGDKEKSRTAELRWKWIENYCWDNGCHRNQNQCNDKWDNLLRDYKKVRDYEMRLGAGSGPAEQQQSYWQLEKHERKEKGLPSNLLFQVYEALHEVVDKRYPLRPPNHQQQQHPPLPQLPLPLPQPQQQHHPPQQHPLQQAQQGTSLLSDKTIPLPQQTPAHSSAPTHLHPSSDPSESSQSEGSEIPPSPAKRRKVGKGSVHGLGPAVARSTSELTQTLLACEERKDQRHRDLLGVEEKKLLLETTKTDISREGIAGLITAINNLASAVLSLASDKNLTAGD